MNKINSRKYNDGYTLLFAVLVSSIVLIIGISILTISKKEFLLSSSARESVYSFYAADTGMECAIYQDSLGKFATSTGVINFYCDDVIVQPNLALDGSGTGIFTFDVLNGNSNLDGVPCAKVSVTQSYDNGNPNTLRTKIVSNGYNNSWSSQGNGSCSSTNRRTVQRSIEYNY